MLLVDVCINLPVKQLSKTYTYELPNEFDKVSVGWRVVVPFAGNLVEGFVLERYFGEYAGDNIKKVAEVIDKEAWFDEKMLAVAKWFSEYYLCTLAEAMRFFLPGKKSIKTKLNYRLVENSTIKDCIDVNEEKLFHALTKVDSINDEEIKKMFGNEGHNIIDSLVKRNVIVTFKQSENKFKKHIVKYAKLLCDVDNYLEQNPKCPKARKKCLELLRDIPDFELSVVSLAQQNVSRDTLKRMEKNGLIEFIDKQVLRNSYDNLLAVEEKLQLNKEQQFAFDKINDSILNNYHKTFLLFGITGSGKTQVYLEAAEASYKTGKQVLVLVPEIALTGQVINRFKARFKENVFVVHSRLSLNERMDVFTEVKKGQPCILIGVRSAIFAPFSNLGLIVMDEEHEFSYKQEERPSYHTKIVAEKLAKVNDIPLVLGSATPSLESFYKAKNEIYQLLKLPNRVQQAQLPEIKVVDMKEELAEGNKSVLSRELSNALQEVVHKNEQAVILLNRRGFSTFILCRDCSYVAKCEHCSVSLVYHDTDKLMHCHYCGYTQAAPHECPSCKSRRIRFFGTGTQKAEQQLQEKFTGLKVIRMDQDTTGGKQGHDKILSAFRKGEYNLLLGTQMVAKGHDVPNVTLVGILAADSMLNLPDFRASERTFALLTQAAGRAGRADKTGIVVLQTYETEHPVIDFVVQQDYESFAEFELNDRKELYYPPFSSIIKVTIVGKQEQEVMKKATKLSNDLNVTFANEENLYINGPFPSMVSKVKDLYKMIIIIKTYEQSKVKKWFKDSKLAEDKMLLIDIDPLNVF